MDPDLELLDRWCAGDEAAGSRLFERHFESMYRFFDAKVVGDAEELVQETFLACVGSRDRFRRQSSFRTFLFAIARHVLYAHWRRNAGRETPLDYHEVSLANLSTSLGTRLVRAEEQRLLLAALRELPLEQQLLLELHYWEGMTSDQLAEVFDVTATTTRTRLHRARRALRERLDEIESLPDLSAASVRDFDAWARSIRAAREDDDGAS